MFTKSGKSSRGDTERGSQTMATLALPDTDVSRAELWVQNSWRPLFAKLRAEDPVNWCPESFFGP